LFLLVFVPVPGAWLAHAPVLRFDLLRGLNRPLDGGATFRGRRLLGDNKTWRGVLVMFAGVFAATLALSLWPAYWDALPDEIREAGPLTFGALLGLGTVAGELPNSFVKRRLGIEPGATRHSPAGAAVALLDQGDIVLGIWVTLVPIWVVTPLEAVAAFAVVAAVHLVTNVAGYAIGARRTAI
jgi:CDP-2,3-bis-(O-geranylgeranyl)-sn-glycerol synthase